MGFNLDDYEPVATRLSRWLADVGAREAIGRVITEMTHHGEGWCVFKASLYENDTLISTGWAEEHASQRGVNSTSHVENCETSAVGRAFYLATWRTHRLAIKQLNALTDKELNDIGIARADIDRLVWLEEDKTMRGRGNDE